MSEGMAGRGKRDKKKGNGNEKRVVMEERKRDEGSEGGTENQRKGGQREEKPGTGNRISEEEKRGKMKEEDELYHIKSFSTILELNHIQRLRSDPGLVSRHESISHK